MVLLIYQKVGTTLKFKPLRLWGISLLALLLSLLASVGFIGIPAVAFMVAIALSGSMSLIYLQVYRGQEADPCNLFAPFNKAQFFHLVGGLAWMNLWIFLWALIPVAGLILAPAKLYAYRFTPYILLTRPEIRATDAIRVSAQETRGYRGKMFAADLAIWGPLLLLTLILLLLARIRFLASLFLTLLSLIAVLAVLLVPLLLGLIQAAFYDEIQHCIADPAYRAQFFVPISLPYSVPVPFDNSQNAQAPSRNQQTPPAGAVQYCPICGQPASKAAKFCNNCGTKLDQSPEES